VVTSVNEASTTTELGGPGPHDVPGASSAKRRSPSPEAGEAWVVLAVEVVVLGATEVSVVTDVGVLGRVVVVGAGPDENWPANGPVTVPGEVRLLAVTGVRGTVIGLLGVPTTPGTVPVARAPVPGGSRVGAPSFGSQASARSVHDPATAQALAANVRSWSRVLAPPVEWMASMATKQATLRQLALPNAVVSTAGRAKVVAATPLEPMVMTELCRLSHASSTEAPGSRRRARAFGSQSTTA